MPVIFPTNDSDRITSLETILSISPPNNVKTPLVPLGGDVINRVKEVHDLFTSTLNRNLERKREMKIKTDLLKARQSSIAKLVQSYWDTVKLYLGNRSKNKLPDVDLYTYYHLQPTTAAKLPLLKLVEVGTLLLKALKEAEANGVPVFQTIRVEDLEVQLDGLGPVAKEVDTYRKYRPNRTAKLVKLRKQVQRVLGLVSSTIRFHCNEDEPNILREKLRSYGFVYTLPGQSVEDVVDTGSDAEGNVSEPALEPEVPEMSLESLGNVDGSPVAPEAIESIG